MNTTLRPIKSKGMLSAFKNDDGTYKKWAYVLFAIAAIFFIKDIAGLTGIIGKNAEYSKEVEMVALEARNLGNTALDESKTTGDYKVSEYEYKYAGPRLAHEHLVKAVALQKKMEKDLAEVGGRSMDDIELYELNDLQLLKEMKASTLKIRKISEDYLLKEEELYQIMVKGIEDGLAKSPDDNVLIGMHEQYLETGTENRKMVADLGKSMLEMYDGLTALFDFLILNHGKYEYTKEDEFIASEEIMEKYGIVAEQVALSSDKYVKAKTVLMEKGTDAMGELNKLINE